MFIKKFLIGKGWYIVEASRILECVHFYNPDYSFNWATSPNSKNAQNASILHQGKEYIEIWNNDIISHQVEKKDG